MLIEINLAPGAGAARKRTALGGLKLPALPSWSGDLRVFGGIAGAWVIVALAVFGYWRMEAREEALRLRIEQEVTDSIQHASTIELMRMLQARQDTVQQKIQLIEQIDSRRYLWGHLLDDISKSVPSYVWLTAIGSSEGTDPEGPAESLTIQGNAGSTQSLTRFMKNLEMSQYMSDVMLITSQQVEIAGGTVQRFSLEARQRNPNSPETPDVLVEDALAGASHQEPGG